MVIAIPDTYLLRERVVDFHNQFRDAVAAGTLRSKFHKKFPPAKRMRELIWDLELAYMARLHVSTLSFKHTMCRAVKRFPLVGESMGMVFTIEKHINMSRLLELTLKTMFYEYLECTSPESFTDHFNSAS